MQEKRNTHFKKRNPIFAGLLGAFFALGLIYVQPNLRSFIACIVANTIVVASAGVLTVPVYLVTTLWAVQMAKMTETSALYAHQLAVDFHESRQAVPSAYAKVK